jgi:hypothetical protein
LALLFTALPGLWTLVRAVGLATVPGKLRAARTWESRLRDPSTSAQVPPLGGHLISAQRLTTAKAAWHTVALGLATGALLLLTLAAFRGALPVEDERGRLGPGLALFTVLVGTVWLFAIRQLCVTRRRWRVERLSASSTDRPAAPAERRTATTVPALTVHLAGPLRPGPVDPDRPLRLLYLRLFDNAEGTERFVALAPRRGGALSAQRRPGDGRRSVPGPVAGPASHCSSTTTTSWTPRWPAPTG